MENNLKANNNIEEIKNLILKSFKFLTDQYLYAPYPKMKDDPTFIEYFYVDYVEEIKRRNIRITYTKGKVYDEIRYTFSCTITRIPYSGVEDIFSLDNYLESKGKSLDSSLINNFNTDEAEKKLKQLAFDLNMYAKQIINGSEWLEKYYPRKN